MGDVKRLRAALNRWKDPLAVGSKWLLWNLAAMLGLWGTGLLVFFFLDKPLWLELIDRGQLFLYSAGFLGQAMFILVKDFKITAFPFRGTLITLASVCFALCIPFFCGYVFTDFSNSPDNMTRTTELRFIGLGFLFASMAIGFAVIIAAENRSDVDYAELGRAGVSRLGSRIEEELDN